MDEKKVKIMTYGNPIREVVVRIKCWKKCSEILPEEGICVLVSDGQSIDIGTLGFEISNGKWVFHDDIPFLITHWMPLPCTPEEENAGMD